ncbi:protein disulfide isomerase [Leptomonas pyrrhocoris]|uniref:Protein disulfide-isomerase n=1 Tax=Leptomonas pyrrhocoris TaxID=157538 RepID=A0A0M9G4E8_LEPPY|nr:protein disulfide isomerase [Leptomonas pyrrhocoris]KPA81909.1 protein disulfide isomerase [Leptomonas pyrrhocoris]|eukprot:XP_015660348.1 protein disulfide isomerase [Leptomonas pyrrhocoris]
MKQSFLLLAVCALFLCVASAEVQVATKSNFDKIIGGDLTLVKFYAPWCGHCKTLAPEFEKASVTLKGVATLAEVDCTKETELASKFDIKGFPTMMIFRNGEKVEDYSGPRTAAGITAYIKAQVGPAVTAIEKAEQLDELKKEDLPVCVVKTASADSALATTMTKVANVFRTQVNFALVTDEAIAADAAMESVTVYRHDKEHEAYAGVLPVTVESAKQFLSEAQLDFLGELGQETFQSYMEANKAKPLGWLFVDKDTAPALKESLVAVAEKFRSQVLMSWVDGDKYRQVAFQLGMPKDVKFPAFVLDFERHHHVMPTETPITAESVSEFVEKYSKGETAETLMSESVPEVETVEGLTTIVGKTVDKYTDGSKNIFVLFYAPWCGHCKKLHPEFEKLAKELESADVIIGKIDATANDFDRAKFSVNGFPTLFFIPAGGKTESYEGGRSLAEMKAFVVSHMASTPEATPSSPSAAPTDENDDDL